jgi:hypothetical protein
MSAPRNLGLGFGEGNQFTISLNEPNRAMINELPLPVQVMDDIRITLQENIAAAADAKKAKRQITKTLFINDVLIPILEKHHYQNDDIHKIISTALALFIPDVLVDMNITRLSKRAIPGVMKNPALSSLVATGLKKFFKYNDDGKLAFYTGEKDAQPTYAIPVEIKEEEEAQVSLRFLRSIIVSKYMKDNPGLVPKEGIEQWKNKIFEEQLGFLYSELTGANPPGVDLANINPKLNLTDNLVYAYLIPAILDRMNDADLKKAVVLIAPYLDITYFKSIAIKNYFQPEIKMAEETVSLSNENKRSLQFFAQANKAGSVNSTLALRDKVYKFQHTHIHFEKDGEEKEYQIKDKNGQLIQFDGEVHNVFEYVLPKETAQATPRKRLVAVYSDPARTPIPVLVEH